jgi:hypothetical protein
MMRFVRSAAALAILSILAGCAAPFRPVDPVEAKSAVALPPGKAAVVLGISATTPRHDALLPFVKFETYVGWITIDPMSHRRVGSIVVQTHLGCDLLAACRGAMIGGVQYQLYLLDPGTYAAAGIQEATLYEAVPSQRHGQRQDDMPLQAVAPTFTVAAGDVAYVGNLAIDFGKPWWVGWAAGQDIDAARAFLSPTGLSDRLVLHPLIRVDGTPINNVDGAPARPPPRTIVVPIPIRR